MADLRSKNRKREHEAHGWFPKPSTLRPAPVNETLMQCPCGWRGWIDTDVLV